MSTRGRVAPRTGRVRMRRALALAGCGVLGVSLAACESTERESARIGRESEVAARAAAPKPSAHSHRRARGSTHGNQTHGAPAHGNPAHSAPARATTAR